MRAILKNKYYLYLTEFFAGMAVMAVELGASRLLAPYFSSSQIVWTIIIGTIMIAMALGNIYGGRSADRDPNPDRLYRRIIIAAVWIALIPVLGKYLILGISAVLIFSVNSSYLIWAAFAACMLIFVPVPYTAKRGEGQGPPDTAALRHEPPPPARDPGQGRGAHFMYLAGLDPILSRGGLQSPPPTPQPHSIPWSHRRGWLGVPFSLFPSFVSVPPSVISVLRPSLFVSLFSAPSSVLPLPSRMASSLLVSPDISPSTQFSRAGPTGRTRLSPTPSCYSQVNPHRNKIQNQIPLATGAGTLRRRRIKLFFCV